MTDSQVKLYGRRWGAVCRANDWRMERGRLVGTAAPSPLHGEVMALAEQHAVQNARGVTVEDLRKACICKITGRYQSAKDLGNAQFSRLLTLFNLLIEPDDIDASMDWDNPERDRVKRVKYFIEHVAPDAYVRTISADKFGTRLWEDLDISDLQQLANTLRARRGKWNETREPDPENCPF